MADNDVYYEVAMQRLDSQMARIDAIDAKVATAFTFATGVLALFGGVLALSALPGGTVVRVAFFVFLAGALIIYGVLLHKLEIAYRITDWEFQPHMSDLEQYSSAYGSDQMRKWVADACVASINHNEPLLAQKAGRLNDALRYLPVEVILLAIVELVIMLGK